MGRALWDGMSTTIKMELNETGTDWQGSHCTIHAFVEIGASTVRRWNAGDEQNARTDTYPDMDQMAVVRARAAAGWRRI